MKMSDKDTKLNQDMWGEIMIDGMPDNADLTDEILENSIREAICDIAAKQNEIRKWKHEYDLEHKTSNKVLKISVISGIAASFVICFSLFLFNKNNGDSLDYEVKGGEPTGVSAVANSRETIISVVNEGDYSVALREINKVLNIDKVLSPKYKINGDEYELVWYKIKTLCALDRDGEAKKILRRYIKLRGKYQKEAIELYNKMEKR